MSKEINNRDLYGEVMTPYGLIEKMLSYLPKEVWKNPENSWLDPTAGDGRFIWVIYEKLMKSLKEWEPDKKRRKEHILTNMLYMVEINPENIKKSLFKEKRNIYCEDILKFKPDKRYDIIVGNPPFNDYYGINMNKKKIQGGKSKLYERIIIYCLDNLLKLENGKMLLISPDNIFSGNTSEIYKKLIKLDIREIEFLEYKKDFPTVQLHMCFFLLINREKRDGINLLDRSVNPIREWTKENEELINRWIDKEKNEIKYYRGARFNKKDEGKYECIYKKGIKIKTDDIPEGLGIPKIVFFAISTNPENYEIDEKGEYGVGPNVFYLDIRKYDVDLIKKFIESSEYKKMFYSTKTCRQYIKNNFIQYLRLNFDDNK